MKLLNKEYAVEKLLVGARMKILLNYSQSIAIIQSLNLNWNSILSYIFLANKAGSGNAHSIAGIECLFEGN